MSERFVRVRRAGVMALAVVSLGLLPVPAAGPSGGPIDAPSSTEPRVEVARSLSGSGFWYSKGVGEPFHRCKVDARLYSRDVLLALPGFQADVETTSKAVKLTLYGNLPEMSDSDCLESSVVLHDSGHFDLDLTLLRGRIVLTNTRKQGAAKVWLRTAFAGVRLTLDEPGTQVALELYGRWRAGVGFSLKPSADHVPTMLWDVYVLKGSMGIKAAKNEFQMSAPPGRAYFRGDSLDGPAEGGPQRLEKLPAWADPKAEKPLLDQVKSVVAMYHKVVENTDESEVGKVMFATAEKEKDKDRAALIRRLLVYALAAMDDVEKVADLLGTAKHADVRQTAVIALRHWIGARAGRDEKLYHILIDGLDYKKAEAETVMQLLHTALIPDQPETYETLIAYLGHRRLAVRELAYWHLVRLAPVGRDIAYDATQSEAARDKAVAAWKKLIPSGELPRAPKKDK